MDDDALAVLAAWRGRGADRVDPVRFGFIEALARRAAAHDGAARQVLDAKLRSLLAAYGEAVEKSTGTGPATDRKAEAPAPAAPAVRSLPAGKPRQVQRPRQEANPGPAARRGALAVLVDDLARHQVPASTGGAAARGLSTAPELKALGQFRNTWSRLNAEQRLKQSLAKLPGNAGPLNSQQLVHRSLVLMREVSPAYLHAFMAYVDALSWMTEAQDGGVASPAAAAGGAQRTEGRGKSSR